MRLVKRCPRCDTLKPACKFYTVASRSDGLHSICKDCSKAQKKKWATDPNRDRSKWLNDPKFRMLKKLRSSRSKAKARDHQPCTSTVDELLRRYTGRCECCDKDVGFSICLDHCHTTGKFRGFLCESCNITLGRLKEDIDTLERLVQYLRSHQ